MTLGSLYSGTIDAFAHAAEIHGIQVLWQVEKEKEAHRYLKKNYPETKKYYYDEFVGKRNLAHVDIIAGGDPCQPHSCNGLRRGKEDDRYRWPQMFRIISELRPSWVINENVVGTISNMVLDTKIADLESAGYSTAAYNIPAICVGAVHIRQRIFLVAHANAKRWERILQDNFRCCEKKNDSMPPIWYRHATLDNKGNAFLQFEKSTGEPALFPVDDGIPNHIFRLAAAGDSIQAQIPIILLGFIKQIHQQLTSSYL
jgi:DNA (cytosine-5)-methyltransferase 1